MMNYNWVALFVNLSFYKQSLQQEDRLELQYRLKLSKIYS